MFSWVELDPKFGILAFSAILVLFSKMVPKVAKWGFWRGIYIKSGLRILIRAPEVPFSVPQ